MWSNSVIGGGRGEPEKCNLIIFCCSEPSFYGEVIKYEHILSSNSYLWDQDTWIMFSFLQLLNNFLKSKFQFRFGPSIQNVTLGWLGNTLLFSNYVVMPWYVGSAPLHLCRYYQQYNEGSQGCAEKQKLHICFQQTYKLHTKFTEDKGVLFDAGLLCFTLV